jgi:multidrug transporter EmrE-like cation transporter
MTSGTFALILTSVTLSALAQVLFKFGVSSVRAHDELKFGMFASALFSPGVIGGLVLYGLGTVLWLGVLARTELSQAYPFVGISFALTALFGYILFQENLNLMRIIGIAMIIAGVSLVART